MAPSLTILQRAHKGTLPYVRADEPFDVGGDFYSKWKDMMKVVNRL